MRWWRITRSSVRSWVLRAMVYLGLSTQDAALKKRRANRVTLLSRGGVAATRLALQYPGAVPSLAAPGWSSTSLSRLVLL